MLAAGVNNTEINTRLGWYSSSVTEATSSTAVTQDVAAEQKADGGWNKATPFPFIQGTDCCGRVIAVAPGEDRSLVGARALVRSCMRRNGFESMENIWMVLLVSSLVCYRVSFSDLKLVSCASKFFVAA